MRIIFWAACFAAFFISHCTPDHQRSDLASDELLTGVVEGFYGDPWTHQERRDMLAFMGEFGLRHYVYAPKDDPLHRSRWAERYPDSSMVQFGKLLQYGDEQGVTIWFAISPGLSMRYSSGDDREALKAKLRQVLDAGFTQVALFFDDVPEQLRHPEDAERFGSLAEAHADVVNDIHAYLTAQGAALWVCPTVYAGTFGDPGYLEELGRLVSPEIPLFWTGPDVASPDLPLADVQAWSEKTGRKPLVWDNFPVNDFEVWRPLMGGYPPRSNEGLQGTLGLIANPSPDPYVSMPGLATMAEMLRDPEGYDPEVAVKAALPQLFGQEALDDVASLVGLYHFYGWEDHPFSPLYKPGLDISLSAIELRLNEAEQALGRLKETQGGNSRLRGFVSEMGSYVSDTRARLEEMKANPLYQVSEDKLVYRDSLDLYVAQKIDGSEKAWSSADAEWYSLHGNAEMGLDRLAMAFAADESDLLATLRLSKADIRIDDSADLFTGDRVSLVVAWDPDTDSTHVSESDPILVMAARSGNDPVIDRFALKLAGFGARGIADIQMRQVSTFFHQFSTQPNSLLLRQIGVETWEDGEHRYFAAKIPLLDRQKVRMNWSASVTADGQTRRQNWMASRRPYLGNPQTWISVLVPR